MKVLITGSTGLVGESLVATLRDHHHEVVRLVRQDADPARQRFAWNPLAGEIDSAAFAGVDAVVHLAGENIAAGRWNDALKNRIRDSRVKGTATLVNAPTALDTPPPTLVGASAIGYYGDRGDEMLTEDSPAGAGYLADVCVAWETACRPAVEKGIRVVNLRIGVVLSAQGGALAKMLTPFKMGAGGVLGGGKQYMSWIELTDVVGVIEFALTNAQLAGPVNTVAPAAATNREFTRALGKVLHRPTIFPVPAPAARLAFGEMADALLLASIRVQPALLQQAGYPFKFPDLESALSHAIKN